VVLGFLLAIVAWFATLSFFVFWPLIAFLGFASVVCLDEDPSWFWWTIWTAPMALFLYFRFQPTAVNILMGAAIYVFAGVIYSVWMWFKECRTLRANADKAMEKVKSWPVTDLKIATSALHNDRYGNNYESREQLLRSLIPNFSEHRSLVSFWTMMWLLLFIKDLTIDLIKNIQDMLKGVYQSIANNQFQS
jgi:hypothetical protein